MVDPASSFEFDFELVRGEVKDFTQLPTASDGLSGRFLSFGSPFHHIAVRPGSEPVPLVTLLRKNTQQRIAMCNCRVPQVVRVPDFHVSMEQTPIGFQRKYGEHSANHALARSGEPDSGQACYSTLCFPGRSLFSPRPLQRQEREREKGGGSA